MLSYDRDALICDLAETYGIYSFDAVPVPTLATLAVGLRDDSRIKTKIRRKIRQKNTASDSPTLSTDTLLLASIADSVAWIQWSRTVDGQKNHNRPKSILSALLGDDKNGETAESKKRSKDTAKRFNAPEDFVKAWKQIGGE